MTKAVIIGSFLLTLTSPAFAQEGHPFDGTWRGELTRNGGNNESVPVVVIMDYDGDSITGMINPGRNSYRFDEAEHDAPNWRITVNTENRASEAVMFSGVMQEIGARNRFIEGTWNQAGVEYGFRITRE